MLYIINITKTIPATPFIYITITSITAITSIPAITAITSIPAITAITSIPAITAITSIPAITAITSIPAITQQPYNLHPKKVLKKSTKSFVI